MNQSRIYRRLLLVLALVVIATLCGLAVRSAGRAHALSTSSAKGAQGAANTPQQLSPAGQAALRAIIQTPMLPELPSLEIECSISEIEQPRVQVHLLRRNGQVRLGQPQQIVTFSTLSDHPYVVENSCCRTRRGTDVSRTTMDVAIA